jgi:hypothetical protein
MRKLPEWIGKSDDTKPPPRVMLRVFLYFNGRCQCGCKRDISPSEKWQLDHIDALINGGENSEYNLQPLLVEHHRNKTGMDVAEKSKTYRKRSKHVGIKRAKRTIPGRRFNGDPIPSRVRLCG